MPRVLNTGILMLTRSLTQTCSLIRKLEVISHRYWSTPARSVVITCCLGCYLESATSLVGPQPCALLASLLAALLLLAVARA